VSVQKVVRGGRIRWLCRWLEDGRHRQRTFDKKGDAVTFEADQRRRRQLGAHAPAEPSRERLGEWLKNWWDRESPGWAAATRIHRGGILDKWIVPYLQGVRLRDLGTARVADWRAEIAAAGCPAHQANQALRVLSAALGVAARDGLMPANPCAGLRRLPHAVSRPRALSPEEVERIRVEMPTMRDIAMLGLLAYAGLRPEEMYALRWMDVGAGVLTIDRAFTAGELKQSKTGQRRTVEIIAPLAADLRLLRPKIVEGDALVAASETGGFLNTNNWRNRVWNTACKRAGVKATPYDGRHTYASLLIAEGRHPLLVSAALGHASGELVSRRYAHLFDEARHHSEPFSMVGAIETARAKLERSGLRASCAQGTVRVLRAYAPGGPKVGLLQGIRGERTTGVEPATYGLGSRRSAN
jgi:integrase